MAQNNNRVFSEIPKTGKYRWNQISHLMPMSKVAWQTLGNSGKAPKGLQLSSRCTLYDAAEIHRWMDDPVGWRA